MLHVDLYMVMIDELL